MFHCTKDCDGHPALPSLVNVTDACRIVPSYRATVKLRVGQHLFTKERDYHDKVMWRCEDRTCGAMVHTVNGGIVKWLVVL